MHSKWYDIRQDLVEGYYGERNVTKFRQLQHQFPSQLHKDLEKGLTAQHGNVTDLCMENHHDNLTRIKIGPGFE